MREVRNADKSWFENLTKRHHSEVLGLLVRFILRWISRKRGLRVLIGFIWLGKGIGGRL
jgi:hypothetical protein